MSDLQKRNGSRRRGRAHNRKSGERYPSGQIKPTVLEQIEEAERRAADQEKATVLAQPHRRGERSALAESALGRFVLGQRLSHDCYVAGCGYAELVFRYYRAKGIPCPVRLNVGSGAGPADDTVEKWERRIDHVEIEIGVRDPHALQPLLNMILFDEDQPSAHWPGLRMGLEMLAVENDRDPFSFSVEKRGAA
jgi:hypothetical protein